MGSVKATTILTNTEDAYKYQLLFGKKHVKQVSEHQRLVYLVQ